MRGGGHTIIDTLVIAVWDEPFIPFLELKLMCTSILLYFSYTNARTALTLAPNAHLGFWYRNILENWDSGGNQTNTRSFFVVLASSLELTEPARRQLFWDTPQCCHQFCKKTKNNRYILVEHIQKLSLYINWLYVFRSFTHFHKCIHMQVLTPFAGLVMLDKIFESRRAMLL